MGLGDKPRKGQGAMSGAIMEQLGIQVRKQRRNTCYFVDDDGQPIRKEAPPGPRTAVFQAAMEQYRRLLEQPGSVPVGEAAAAADRILDPFGALSPGEPKPDVPAGPTGTGPTAARGAAGPYFTGPSDEGVEQPVRKDDGSPNPIDELGVASTRLVTAFRDSEGRDPTTSDGEFWKAYRKLIKAWVDSAREEIQQRKEAR